MGSRDLSSHATSELPRAEQEAKLTLAEILARTSKHSEARIRALAVRSIGLERKALSVLLQVAKQVGDQDVVRIAAAQLLELEPQSQG